MIGRVYIIKSHQTDKVYIGSTIQPLKHRLKCHKNDYKKFLKGTYHYVSSFEIVQYDICYIELLEEVNIENKQELHMVEGKYIKGMDCINKRIAGRSKKEYYQDNKEKAKEYYQDNKEKMKEKNKNYYQDNKKRISERYKVKMTCECGSIVRKSDIAKHRHTLKHKKYMDNINEVSKI